MEQDDFGDQTHPEDVGGIQSFPVLERDASGKLTPDSQAAIAIAGMLPGPVADEAERLEAEYQEHRKTDPAKPALNIWEYATGWLAQTAILKFAEQDGQWAGRHVSILRRMIALLALNYQESQNKIRQMQVQRAFYDQYLLMQEGNTKFRAFLLENFPDEMKVADATNQPLIQFAQGLMLQLKRKQ